MVVVHPDDQPSVPVVQMVGRFVFQGRTYPPGSWLVLSEPRRALTHDEYLEQFWARPRVEF